MAAPERHPLHHLIDTAACKQGADVARLIRVLDRVRPNTAKAVRLMEIIGVDFQLRAAWTGEPGGGYVIEPHRAYVSFACTCARAADVLRRHGWELHRSGGHYNDSMWISEQSGSPG